MQSVIFMEENNKSNMVKLNSLGPLLILALIHWMPFVFASELFHWEPKFCDHSCPGSWILDNKTPYNFYRPQVSIVFEKQRFDFKNKVVSGDDIEIIGKSLWIRAPKACIEYATDSKRWMLSGPVLSWVDDLILESRSAIYDQTQDVLEAEEIEFLFKPYQLYGTANFIRKRDHIVELNHLIATQCPPDHQSWSMKIKSMTYDIENDLLTMHEPGLFIHDYQVFYLDKFEFEGLRAKHRLENLPQFHIETNSGLAIQMPIVWTKQEETLALIPEINTKQGIGMGVALSKDHIHSKGFFQILPFGESDQRSWMISAASHHELPDFSYGYQGALVSDPAFCYRYPGLIEFWEDLYLVNYGWISKQTAFGKWTLSSEKLYRSQEAREDDYEVIEYLGRLDWSSNDIVRNNVGADIIHRYDDQTYQRLRWLSDYHLGAGNGISYRLSAYPKDQVYTGALQWATRTKNYSTLIGRFDLAFVGSVANKASQPLLLDVIAQPISVQFLQNAQWHEGLDWNSNTAWVTPSWMLPLSSSIAFKSSIAYALKRPENPWVAANQPYLTPFRDDDRFSPLAIEVIGDRWSGQMLYDLLRGECVTAQWEQRIDFEAGVVSLRAFYHDYYPQDRLSQVVDSVAQLGYDYQTKKTGPWDIHVETAWNLIPIKLANAAVSLKYDDCCWQFCLKAKADQQYDPDTSQAQWHYSLGFQLEINAIGMLSSKENPWAAISEQPWRFVSKNNY